MLVWHLQKKYFGIIYSRVTTNLHHEKVRVW